MDKIVIEGVPPYDGEYEFDFGGFTNRELHRIKQVTKLRAGEFEEALNAVDTDIYLGLAVIALERHGKFVDVDLLWDAPGGTLRLVLEPEAASPPEETQKKSPDSPAQTSEPRTSSGEDLSDDSDPPESGLSRIGPPDLPKSPTSGQAISAI